MKSKLYKTHRKASYYRLRRLGYFSVSLMIATILVIVPITLAQASTLPPTSSSASTSDPSSETSSVLSSDISEVSSEETSEEVDASLDGSANKTVIEYYL
jgi:cytoskeletal protein RodZ